MTDFLLLEQQSLFNKVTPIVSVIIPTYNREGFIGEAIQSVLEQTFFNFEIIVVDDGSSDGSAALIQRFSDARIIFLRQENKGRSCARNRALAQASGRYIAFLDSDDLYMPGKLATQVQYLDAHPEVGMVYTSAYCIDSFGNSLNKNYQASVSGYIYSSIAFFQPVTITLPTVMVRRELLAQAGGFDEKMHRFEDTDMWRRISKLTRIDALSGYTCKLRTHADNSLTAQDPVQIVSSLHYYVNKILEEDTAISKLVKSRGIGSLYYYYGRAFLTVPAWTAQGNQLLRIACQYWFPLRLRHLAVTVYKWCSLNKISNLKRILIRACRFKSKKKN